MAEQGPSANLPQLLLHWYDAHARTLPWRVKGQLVADPYKVWLSEIMLQQTTVAAVIGYFNRFVSRWPTVEALAAADRDDIMREWAGLGYYARARNLHACAKVVVETHGGKFPATEEALLQLPGIGPYTAGAIAAIAFNAPAAAVDGNVERVISRLYAIEVPLPASKPEIRQRTIALVPKRRAGDFAQALMDLGATICTPKSPNCLICPLTAECRARQRGLAETLPLKMPKKTVPVRKAYAYWVQRSDGAVLLRKRPDKGLLGGMLEIPSTTWTADLPDDSTAGQPVKTQWRAVKGIVKHTFTHFHLEITVLAGQALTDETPADSHWAQRDELAGEALPTVMRKIVAHMSGETT